MKKIIKLIVIVAFAFKGFSQDDQEQEKSVIQEYTPSKLLNKGQ